MNPGVFYVDHKKTLVQEGLIKHLRCLHIVLIRTCRMLILHICLVETGDSTLKIKQSEQDMSYKYTQYYQNYIK